MALNYYQEIIVKIKNLIKDKNFIQAKQILDEELAIVYVPLIYEKELKQLLIEVEQNLITNKLLIDKNQFEFTIKKNNLSKEDLRFVLENIDQVNINHYLVDLATIFQNKYSSQLKITLFEILVKNKINYQFEIILFNKKYFLNPSQQTLIKESSFIANISSLIEKYLYHKNIIEYEIALSILDLYSYYLYPNLNQKVDFNAIAVVCCFLAIKFISSIENESYLSIIKDFNVEEKSFLEMSKKISDVFKKANL